MRHGTDGFAAARRGPATRPAAARGRRAARPRARASTPNCSRARRRASAISASASAAVAPPAFSMKFACRGEISAPPIRWPFSPQASSIRPAPSSCVRVLEDAAEGALVRRLRRLALRLHLGDGRLDLLGRPRRRAGTRPARRPGRGCSAGVAVREVELARRQPAPLRRRRRRARARGLRAKSPP